jgi:ATP-dependent protease Clp ATPase subunit
MERQRLVAGPGVSICNECITVCSEIMAADGVLAPQREVAVPRLATLLQVWIDGIDLEDRDRVQEARALLERFLAQLDPDLVD